MTQEDVKDTEEKEFKEVEIAEEKAEESSTSEEVIDEVAEKYSIIKKELEEMKQSLLRERADFANFRKRTIQEKQELEGVAASKILAQLLPALDSFDQLFSQEFKEIKQVLDGVTLIRKQVDGVFSEVGVEQINPENEAFDPSKMEALGAQESDEVEVETVGQVYQKGYMLDGRVLRSARVMVLKPLINANEAVAEGGEIKSANNAEENKEQ